MTRAEAAAVVVGGGPAGLATAACLRRTGIDALVLEEAPRLGDRWRRHYDRLHLHTARTLSGLPGLALPRAAGQWVARDDMAAYLERYARHHRLDVELATTVSSIRRRDGGAWEVVTAAGTVSARRVVVATGYNRRAHVPDWPGLDRFRGRVLHGSDYRDPAPFRDQLVAVVGTGNSGSEIAVDLAEGGARRVLLSVRTPPNIIPRDVLGVPIQFAGVALGHAPPWLGDPLVRLVQLLLVPDLRPHGLPRPRRGVATQFAAGGTAPMLDVGLVDAIRSGAVTVVAAVERFDEEAVVLADGTALQVDAVIAATGYRQGLEELVPGLGVLRADGVPRVNAAPVAEAPGLYFVGYRPPISGHLREIGRDAIRTAQVIAGEAGRPRPPAAPRAGAPTRPRPDAATIREPGARYAGRRR